MSVISSLAKFTNIDEPARWPSGAHSRPSGRRSVRAQLCHAQRTSCYSDVAGAREIGTSRWSAGRQSPLDEFAGMCGFYIQAIINAFDDRRP